MKIVIWGTGGTLSLFLDARVLYADHEIVAFTDNNSNVWGELIHGIPVLPPGELQKMNFDKVIICVLLYQNEIYKQLLEEIGVGSEKIWLYSDVENALGDKLRAKYQECTNPDIQKILSCYSEKGFSIYGSYYGDGTKHTVVERDKDGMPFIWFEGKKMYFPQTYKFRKENNSEYIPDILFEQKYGSPHLYIQKEDDIKKNGVIVDAGVCEGNFALRYVDKVRKIYLVESDPQWVEALKRTFYDWKDKVVICNKFLTRYQSENTITLDDLVEEKIDFLKMDIEGGEIDALLGGKNILQSSRAKCAICSYHRQNDEQNIRFILEALGYQTAVSQGYMFFIFDPYIKDTMDFRRGIVYGEKE